MNLIIVLPYYIRWHYSQALSDMARIWKDFLEFIYHFFSIHLLLFSLFSPLKRMHEGYSRGVDIGAFFGTLVVNVIMRIIGAIVRLIVIIFGVLALVFGLVFAVITFVAWLFLPVIMIFLFVWGFVQLMI